MLRLVSEQAAKKGDEGLLLPANVATLTLESYRAEQEKSKQDRERKAKDKKAAAKKRTKGVCFAF